MSATAAIVQTDHARELKAARLDYFPVPLREVIRLGLRVLAMQTADPSAPLTDPARGENAARLLAEDILETYMQGAFTEKVGVPLSYADKYIAQCVARGMSEEAAIKKLLARIQQAEAQQ